VLVTSWAKIIPKSCRRIKSASIPTIVLAVMPLRLSVAILIMLIGTVGAVEGLLCWDKMPCLPVFVDCPSRAAASARSVVLPSSPLHSSWVFSG